MNECMYKQLEELYCRLKKKSRFLAPLLKVLNFHPDACGANCEKMEGRVELDKKMEGETRKRTESEKEKLMLEKRDEEEKEGRKRGGSMQDERKKEEREEKPRQMGRQRSETRSEQLSQVIGGI